MTFGRLPRVNEKHYAEMKTFFNFVALSNQLYILKVFSDILLRKCGSFQKRKDNGQHSFSFGLCGVETSVFPGASYLLGCGASVTFIFAWVLPQPS